MGGLFVFDVVFMLILGQFLKREPYVENTINKGDVDLTNWKYIKVTSVSLILGLIALYAFLSPIGIASPRWQSNVSLGSVCGITTHRVDCL